MNRTRSDWEASLRRGVRAVADRLRMTGGFSLYALRRFYFDHCLEAAGSLSYTSLLAIVPAFAVGLSALTAFPLYADARQAISQMILRNLVPQVGEVVDTYVTQFAGAAVQLTAVGIVGLAVTAVLLLATIEWRFNFIWRVPTERPWLGRILAYWAILTLGPLLLGASLSLSSRVLALAEEAGLGVVLSRAAWGFPFLLSVAAFSGLYLIIPNRTVRWGDGIMGGLVAAVLFQLIQSGFGYYVTRFVSYQAVYGAIAALPIFLLWMYLTWAVVLFGAVVAAGLPDWRAERFGGRTSGTHTLTLALSLAILDGLRAPGGRRVRELARRLGLAATMVDDRLHALYEAGYVAPTGGGRWLLARDLHEATVDGLAHALGLHRAGELGPEFPSAAWTPRFNAMMRSLSRAEQTALDIPIAAVLDEPAPPVPDYSASSRRTR
ncbi:YihY family inner membrane protein [Stella sp.]|uniref:YihY family inner membrane protein n=1 Tax=Stella sp. TaxID=2912054 RepID=UPI0035B2E9A2